MSESFPKKNRLLYSRQFQAVFKPVTGNSPRKFFSENFLVLVVPNRLASTRLGLVIKKKNVKLSVRRNTLKRVVRESFRTHCSIIKAGLDLVVVVNKFLPKKTFAVLLDRQWQNILKYYKKA